MYKVNIYIEADKKAPQRLERRYCFLLEYIRKDGRTETRFTLRSVRLTYNEAVLKATVEALGKLNKNCQVAIYTDNDYVKSMYETELDKWEQKDFKALAETSPAGKNGRRSVRTDGSIGKWMKRKSEKQ